MLRWWGWWTCGLVGLPARNAGVLIRSPRVIVPLVMRLDRRVGYLARAEGHIPPDAWHAELRREAHEAGLEGHAAPLDLGLDLPFARLARLAHDEQLRRASSGTGSLLGLGLGWGRVAAVGRLALRACRRQAVAVPVIVVLVLVALALAEIPLVVALVRARPCPR